MLVPMSCPHLVPPRREFRPSRGRFALAGLALLFVLLGAPVPARGDDTGAAAEAARKNAIKGLKSKIRKLARSRWVAKKTPDLLKNLEALGALKGHEAGLAALEALPATDTAVRDMLFDIVEREHHKKLVKPLAELLEAKPYRRDFDARRRIAHALSVMADPTAIEPLATLIRFHENAEVVAEAADALGGYGAAKIDLRRDRGTPPRGRLRDDLQLQGVGASGRQGDAPARHGPLQGLRQVGAPRAAVPDRGPADPPPRVAALVEHEQEEAQVGPRDRSRLRSVECLRRVNGVTAGPSGVPRKVRAPQGAEVGNAHRARASGKC